MKDNPCYDRKTKQGCPRRCCGCAKDCTEWDEYVTQRNNDYQKKKDMRITDGYEVARDKKIKKYLKRYSRHRT